jgi:hypothetical protein
MCLLTCFRCAVLSVSIALSCICSGTHQHECFQQPGLDSDRLPCGGAVTVFSRSFDNIMYICIIHTSNSHGLFQTMHTSTTSARFSCMYLCLQASRACFVASPPSQVPTSFTIDKLHAATRRQLPQGTCPSEWSAEEAYYRTGVYSSAVLYVASMHGGARRALPLFAADISTAASRSRRNAGECTKHQNSHGALSPGVFVCWIYGTLSS